MAAERFDVGAWFGRLGVSGKLVVTGALIGVVAMFLPLASFEISVAGGVPSPLGRSLELVRPARAVINDARGPIALLAYAAALVFAVLLYPPAPTADKRGGASSPPRPSRC